MENNKFQVFKIAKFEFKVTVHYGYGQIEPNCDPLTWLFCFNAS